MTLAASDNRPRCRVCGAFSDGQPDQRTLVVQTTVSGGTAEQQKKRERARRLRAKNEGKR